MPSNEKTKLNIKKARSNHFSPVKALLSAEYDPLFWTPERLGIESAWWGHVPFAFWIATVTRPRLFVELGTHNGVSYSAFCEAVVRSKLPTKCYAVDSWAGDPHAGIYDESVYENLRAFHDKKYENFSTLMRSSFSDALKNFKDGTIDLLHIDGFHAYEAVKNDFETWQAKLSDRAIVLFHDTNVKRDDFGVWRLWADISQQFPSFEFFHSYGLGVLATGTHAPDAIRVLCSLSKKDQKVLRQRFEAIGDRWLNNWEKDHLISAAKQQLQDMAAHRSVIESSLEKSDAALVKYRDDLTSVQEEMKIARTKLRAQQQELQASRNELLACKNEFTAIRLDLENSKNELDAVWKTLANLSDGFRPTKQSSFWHKVIWGEGPRNVPNMDTVLNSPLFDKDWYLAQNPDVAQANIEPAKHYCDFGADEGRQPGPFFDGPWYLEQYQDVAAAKLNPLVHFIKYGWGEGRSIRTVISGRILRLQLSENQIELSPKSFVMKWTHSVIRVFKPDSASGKFLVSSKTPSKISLLQFIINALKKETHHQQKLESLNNGDKFKSDYRQRMKINLDEFLKSSDRIPLSVSNNPEVSIILVLYNNAELTLETLQSLTNTSGVSLQVILIDNASSDRTPELCARIDGAEIIRNTENLHYLRAVNQAAALTKGSFVLLLNNDVYVASDAIEIARNILREETDVGGVGSKIVLLDGTLQEAGSIIWQDGSCLGYGRGRDPSDAEFQFRRDVDYCSAAFLLLRQRLFKELNWLDEAFAPAYYEDTDLCMRIRAAGYRLIYEPRIVIKHFEFGSSTTSDAAISLQKRNHAVFQNKHRSILESKHLPSTTGPLGARMRPHDSCRILVIDDQLPYPSLGSGYPRANAMVHAIHAAGWFITFYPITMSNVSWPESRSLFPNDIEIMADYGTYRFEAFLSSRVGYYDLVFVSRPHNMDLFKKACKNLPAFLDRTKVIYDAEAVFSSRDAMHRNLKGYPDSKAITAQNFEKEISLVENATAIIAVSEKEAELFRNASKAKVHVLGHGVKAAPIHTPFQQRKNILFVGALDDNDSPNVDSLVWFIKDIMPKLDKLLGKDYVLKVIGRNASQAIQALAGKRVQLLGRVADIRPYYESSRLFIAPTRFSAGIPLKVLEAAAAGLPVVATSQLAEQLGWQNNVELLIADQPSDFATACHSLYTRPKVWEHVRSAALMRIEQECDPSRFATQVANILAECAPKRSR